MLSLEPKYLQRLVESSTDMIIAVDRQGVITYYNDGARQSLGYSPEEVIGRRCTDSIYPSLEEARRVMRAMRESSNNGRITSFETEFRDKQGQMIPVMISGGLIRDDQGSEIGSIGFARDIRRMRQREQLATAGEIAVSLAHEINNPLESILNNIELVARAIESHLSESDKLVENERVDSIRTSIERVQAIIRRLDEMTRRGVYETRDYLNGKRMADLAPREAFRGRPHPSQSAAAQAKAAMEPSAEYPLAGMSVIVLDDDLEVTNSLADLLRAERCIVHCALRPSTALGVLRNIKVDAVISDVVMPEMDGYDFYMTVKSEIPSLPVILMTAYYYDKDHIMKRARLKGLEGALFKKPVNPQKLRQLLVQVRQKSSESRANGADSLAQARR